MLKEISGSTTIEPSVSTPSTLNTCRQIVQKTLSIEKFPTSYSGSVALVASAFHPLKTSSSTGDLGSQTIIRGCLHFLQKLPFHPEKKFDPDRSIWTVGLCRWTGRGRKPAPGSFSHCCLSFSWGCDVFLLFFRASHFPLKVKGR